jgi:anti-sigma-K factor RsiG
VEALPDLKSLSDEELRDLIAKLVEDEHEVSYQRRILHGRIDILKAELQARLQQQVGEEGSSPLYEVDVDKLAAILASRAAPPDTSS